MNDRLKDFAQALSERMPDLDERSDQIADGASKSFDVLKKTSEGLIAKYPVAALATAVGVGLALGYLVKKR